MNRLKEQGILIETKPGSPRSLAINNAVSLDGKVIQVKHLGWFDRVWSYGFVYLK